MIAMLELVRLKRGSWNGRSFVVDHTDAGDSSTVARVCSFVDI